MTQLTMTGDTLVAQRGTESGMTMKTKQEQAAAQLTRIVRRIGADGGKYIHGYKFCERCQKETLHRAFADVNFPVCQEAAHRDDEED